MASFKILIRLLGFVSLPLVVLGAAVAGALGAGVGFLLVVVFFGLLVVATEKIMIHTYGAHRGVPAGLRKSSDHGLEQVNSSTSRLLIYPEPFPDALVVRGLGSQGSILISQGLIVLLNDAELTELIQVGLARLQEPELVYQSLSSVFAGCFLNLIPRSWSKLVFVGQLSTIHDPVPGSGNFMHRDEKMELDPFSMVVFLIIYPIVQFFLEAARLRSANGTLKSCPAITQRIGNLIPLIGDRKNHGTASLSIIF